MGTATKPSTQTIPVFCKCGHAWTQTIIVNVEVSVCNKFLSTIACPKCGTMKGGELFMGRKPKKGQLHTWLIGP